MKCIIKCIILLSLVFVFGCEINKSKVEIIPNYDSSFYTEKEVDELPTFKDSLFERRLNKEAEKMVKEFSEKEGYSGGGVFPLNYDLYISEEGKIIRVKNLPETSKLNYEGLKVFPDESKMDMAFANWVASWELTPAFQSGKPVRLKKTIKASLILRADGSTKIDLGSWFLKNIASKRVYFMAVEQMPEPIGGISGIQKKIVYPEIARRAGIEGRVFVKAYINENGDVTYTEIIKGIGGGCDQAAESAVKQTKFKPGIQRGKPVKVQVSIPILFKIQ